LPALPIFGKKIFVVTFSFSNKGGKTRGGKGRDNELNRGKVSLGGKRGYAKRRKAVDRNGEGGEEIEGRKKKEAKRGEKGEIVSKPGGKNYRKVNLGARL